MAVLLLQLIRLSQGRVWGWLNHSVSVYLGVISYPIYLWHVWGIQAGKKLIFLPESLQLVAGIVISCMLAALSYHLLEKQFLLLKHKYERVRNDSTEKFSVSESESKMSSSNDRRRSDGSF